MACPVSDSTLRSERNYVLLTGGTGLVGQYLVKELLEAGQRVALVVRHGKKVTARMNVLKRSCNVGRPKLGSVLARPVVLVQETYVMSNLGLSDEAARLGG